MLNKALLFVTKLIIVVGQATKNGENCCWSGGQHRLKTNNGYTLPGYSSNAFSKQSIAACKEVVFNT